MHPALWFARRAKVRSINLVRVRFCPFSSAPSRRYFREPIETPQELLRELRDFAATSRPTSEDGASVSSLPRSKRRKLPATLEKKSFPLDFAEDVESVIKGDKYLVAEQSYRVDIAGSAVWREDRLSFKCTGCGACCKGFADTVNLDCEDLRRISRHPSIEAPRQDGDDRFRDILGLFSRAALPSQSTMPALIRDDDDLTAGRTRGLYSWQDSRNVHYSQQYNDNAGGGVGPLLFLRSKEGENGGKDERISREDENGGKEEGPICSFALKTPTGLSCTLGPLSMPTTCSLYPFGELWASPPVPRIRGNVEDEAGDTRGKEKGETRDTRGEVEGGAGDAPRQRSYYSSLDAKRCEGVVQVLQGVEVGKRVAHEHSASESIHRYRQNRRLDERRTSSAEFRLIQTAAASLQFDERLADAAEASSVLISECLCWVAAVEEEERRSNVVATSPDQAHLTEALASWGMALPVVVPTTAGSHVEEGGDELRTFCKSRVYSQWKKVWYFPATESAASPPSLNETILQATKETCYAWTALLVDMAQKMEVLESRFLQAKQSHHGSHGGGTLTSAEKVRRQGRRRNHPSTQADERGQRKGALLALAEDTVRQLILRIELR